MARNNSEEIEKIWSVSLKARKGKFSQFFFLQIAILAANRYKHLFTTNGKVFFLDSNYYNITVSTVSLL